MGVDHTSASPDDTNQFGANGFCSARGFDWETGRRIYDAFSISWTKLEPERACTVCTCGERSKHFMEDMMNLVLLFSQLNFLELWLSQTRLAPCCMCTCGKRPKHFIEDMKFETKQRCAICPPSKQNKTRFTCNDGEHLFALITFKFSAKITQIPEILTWVVSTQTGVAATWSLGENHQMLWLILSSGDRHPML